MSKKPSVKNPYVSKGVPLFAQDPTIARGGYHAHQGTLATNQTKLTKGLSKVRPSDDNFKDARAKLVANLKARKVPTSTNWRTSAIPISHRRPR